MKVEPVVVLTDGERAKFMECVIHLRSICVTMQCPNSITCETCPFDQITDKAFDLADEIMGVLHKCKTEGE